MTDVSAPTEEEIRDHSTEAVFERGEKYLREDRIEELSRFQTGIEAVVRGSRTYDLTLDLAGDDLDATCSCPYDGPGVCKHIVAVSLRLIKGLPTDESEQIQAALDRADADALWAFLRDEVGRNSSLRDRFLARFGEGSIRSAEEIRAEIDRTFEETNPEYEVVFDPIDFSEWFDLAETYREQGSYRAAETVYRALVASLDDNMNLVDGSYDHYARAFSDALDGYVDCVVNEDLDSDGIEERLDVLESRAERGTDYLREQFERAIGDLRERVDQ